MKSLFFGWKLTSSASTYKQTQAGASARKIATPATLSVPDALKPNSWGQKAN